MDEPTNHNELLFQGIADASGSLIYATDLDGRFIFANAAFERLVNAEPGAIVGKTRRDFLPQAMCDEHRANDQKVIESGETLTLEEANEQADGLHTYLSVKSPIRDVAGRVFAVAGTSTDITQRKRAEDDLRSRTEDLERSNAELQRFAYIASHDLREPLRMVTSYTQLLKKRYGGQLDADADDFIHFAVEGAERMELLIQDLLDYSHVGSQGRPLVEANLEPVLDGVLKGLEVAIAESCAEVTHDPMPVVTCDASQVGQVLQNLISNAIRFRGDAPPRIHVGVKQSGDECEFSVSDNGIGVDAEYFDRIFVIFQRLHARDAYSGSGMGLAICKRIVERHNGRMWVESKPGEGATFFFTLPCWTGAATELPQNP